MGKYAGRIVITLLLLMNAYSVCLAQDLPGITIEHNVDRPGGDYKNFDMEVPDPAICMRQCQDDPQCKAFTVLRSNGSDGPKMECYLKNNAQPSNPNGCCISGRKLDQPSPTRGSARIREAGFLPIPVARAREEKTLTAQPPIETPSMTCAVSTRNSYSIGETADKLMLSSAQLTVWPGAIIQGGRYLAGQFVPVTIPRAGGTVYTKNLYVDPTKYPASVNVPEIKGEIVQNAILKMLSVPDQDMHVPASAMFELRAIYNKNHLFYKLDVDAKYKKFAFNGSFEDTVDKERTYVLATLKQDFFTVTIDPTTPITGVFKDGENFQDPENQIRPGNPPMLVNSVTYGRLIMILVESEYDDQTTKIALNLAYGDIQGTGKDAVVKDNGGTIKNNLTVQDVLRRARIQVFVLGGDAGFVADLIPEDTTPTDKYSKLWAAFRQADKYRMTSTNPGFPLKFSMTYLADNSQAVLSQMAEYDEKDCKYKNLVKPITLDFWNIDDFIDVKLNNIPILQKDRYRKGKRGVPSDTGEIGYIDEGAGNNARLDLIDLLKWWEAKRSWESPPYTLRVDLYNGGCWGTSVNLDVYLDGTVIAEDHLDLPGRDYSRSYGHGYGLNCGKTNLDWGYLIDPFTGVTRTDHFCDKYDNYDSNCR